MNNERYVIVREYSGVTAMKQLWQVLSRPLYLSDVQGQLDSYKHVESKRPKNRRGNVFAVRIEAQKP